MSKSNVIPMRHKQGCLESDETDTYGDMLRLMASDDRESFENLPTERKQQIHSDFRASGGDPSVLLFKDRLINLRMTMEPARYKVFEHGLGRYLTLLLNGKQRLADREIARLNAKLLYE